MLSERQIQVLEKELELCTSIFDDHAGRVRMTVYYQAGVPELSARFCAKSIPDAESLGLPRRSSRNLPGGRMA